MMAHATQDGGNITEEATGSGDASEGAIEQAMGETNSTPTAGSRTMEVAAPSEVANISHPAGHAVSGDEGAVEVGMGETNSTPTAGSGSMEVAAPSEVSGDASEGAVEVGMGETNSTPTAGSGSMEVAAPSAVAIPLTLELNAGILPFLCLRDNKPQPKGNHHLPSISCPWNPKALAQSRVQNLCTKLTDEPQGHLVSALDGPTILVVLTTFESTHQQGLHPPDIMFQPECGLIAVPLTVDVLQNAIEWLDPNVDKDLGGDLSALACQYIQLLQEKLHPPLTAEDGSNNIIKDYCTKLKKFIGDHAWGDESVEEIYHLQQMPNSLATAGFLQHFILKHLAWVTKVAAHTVNGLVRVEALQMLMTKNLGKEHELGWLSRHYQRKIQVMLYLPCLVDSKFASGIRDISSQHQQNTKKMEAHTVLHFLKWALEYAKSNQKYVLLSAGLEEFYSTHPILTDIENQWKEHLGKLHKNCGGSQETRELFIQNAIADLPDELAGHMPPEFYIRSWVQLMIEGIGDTITDVGVHAGLQYNATALLETFQVKSKLAKKTKKLSVFPYTTLRAVSIYQHKAIYPSSQYGKGKQMGKMEQTIIPQILLWARLSPEAEKAITFMISTLGEKITDPQKAKNMLYSFFHTVIDVAEVSKNPWRDCFFKSSPRVHPVQSTGLEVLRFCLLQNAVINCSTAFQELHASPEGEMSALLDDFQATPMDKHFFPGCPMDDELLHQVQKAQNEFFPDWLSFVTVAYSLTLRNTFNDSNKHVEIFDKHWKKWTGESLSSSLKSCRYIFHSTLVLCPFGNTDKVIDCLGPKLDAFVRKEFDRERIHERIKVYLAQLFQQKFRKSFLKCANGVFAEPTTPRVETIPPIKAHQHTLSTAQPPGAAADALAQAVAVAEAATVPPAGGGAETEAATVPPAVGGAEAEAATVPPAAGGEEAEAAEAAPPVGGGAEAEAAAAAPPVGEEAAAAAVPPAVPPAGGGAEAEAPPVAAAAAAAAAAAQHQHGDLPAAPAHQQETRINKRKKNVPERTEKPKAQKTAHQPPSNAKAKAKPILIPHVIVSPLTKLLQEDQPFQCGIRQYLEILPDDDPNQKVFKTILRLTQSIVRHMPKERNSAPRVDIASKGTGKAHHGGEGEAQRVSGEDHAIQLFQELLVEGNDEAAQGSQGQTLPELVRQARIDDEVFDQVVAKHRTEKFGDGADEESSDESARDDTFDPYRRCEFVDDVAHDEEFPLCKAAFSEAVDFGCDDGDDDDTSVPLADKLIADIIDLPRQQTEERPSEQQGDPKHWEDQGLAEMARKHYEG